MKKTILLTILICTGMYLKAQIDNCSHNNTNWKSDKEAIETIESSDFATTDMIFGEVSSWIESAHFYSCNMHSGFLIVKSKKKTFVHQDVPTKVWEALKDANSKGGYYNFYIKNKFKLQKGKNNNIVL